MPSKNKFGFEPLETKSMKPRERSVGPMGAAVRETAENLAETTEAKVEQRRKNAEDARAFRTASEAGLILRQIPLERIQTDDLPRDRMELDRVAESDEMEELKASIRARGQKEPIELYRDGQGQLQLKKGWRRLTALRQLLSETGDEKFAQITARIDEADEDHLTRYLDMVEENVVREDLSFAEMAQVAITAWNDERIGDMKIDDVVLRLYGSLHKMKRSNIRSFVTLLETFDEALSHPRSISRNLGVEAARVTRSCPELVPDYRARLEDALREAEMLKVLEDFVRAGQGAAKPVRVRKPAKQKYEFHVGKTKVTARKGQCRIVSDLDYADLPKEKLERAIKAFEAALEDDLKPRLRST